MNVNCFCLDKECPPCLNAPCYKHNICYVGELTGEVIDRIIKVLIAKDKLIEKIHDPNRNETRIVRSWHVKHERVFRAECEVFKGKIVVVSLHSHNVSIMVVQPPFCLESEKIPPCAKGPCPYKDGICYLGKLTVPISDKIQVVLLSKDKLVEKTKHPEEDEGSIIVNWIGKNAKCFRAECNALQGEIILADLFHSHLADVHPVHHFPSELMSHPKWKHLFK